MTKMKLLLVECSFICMTFFVFLIITGPSEIYLEKISI